MDDEAVMMSSTPPGAGDFDEVSVTTGKTMDGCGRPVRCQRPEPTGPAASKELPLPCGWNCGEPIHRAKDADDDPSIEGDVDLAVGQTNHASVLQLEHAVILGCELRETIHPDIQPIG